MRREQNSKRNNYKYWGILIILCITFFVAACSGKQSELISLEELEGKQAQEIEESGEVEDTEKESTIFVYVCGAVAAEGVYKLPQGSRAFEAIAKAGGFRADAATSSINQAEILKDEMQLYIPTVEEVMQETAQKEAEDEGKVNLNTASREELMTLPGVGESKADSILKYREENGGFQTIEDIMQISGIKEGLFSKIKDYITV